MKLQALFLLLPLLAAASPLAEPIAEPGADMLAERAALRARASHTCALTGSNVKYRKCPSTDDKKCPAVGEYGAKGTKVSFKCYTTGGSVNGNT